MRMEFSDAFLKGVASYGATILFFLAIATAFVGLAAGLASLELSKRSDVAVANAQGDAATANKLAGDANERAGRANERAGVADQKAAEAKERTVALEVENKRLGLQLAKTAAAVSQRNLSPEEFATLSAAAKQVGETRIEVAYDHANPETLIFATQIIRALELGGATVELSEYAFPGMIFGHGVQVSSPLGLEPPGGVDPIVDALKAIDQYGGGWARPIDGAPGGAPPLDHYLLLITTRSPPNITSKIYLGPDAP